MNLNYLKIAWRILLKHKIHTAINIIGLGIGFSVSVLMMIYVYHQLSYDEFHQKKDRIFRITIDGVMADGKVLTGAITAGEVVRVVLDEVPELEHALRVYQWGGNDVIIGDKRFTDDAVAWVDSAFFLVFDFPLKMGNPHLALNEPFQIVVSASTAQKYFGRYDVLGEILKVGDMDYQITGVMEDMPVNSHFRYDMLATIQTLERPDYNVVRDNGLSFPTYVLMRDGADRNLFEEKICFSADEYVNDIFNQHGIHIIHALQPLNEIYLHSDFTYDSSTRGDIRNVYIFSFLAFMIILIAIFNFVNLVTAQSEKRTREIGMRKVMGAMQKDLVLQFIGESVLIALFAYAFSLLISELLIDPFSQMLGENLRLEYWHNPIMLLFILGFVLLTGILAGFYPAFYLSRFQPVLVLKGLQRPSGSTHVLRKFLVVFQFAISIFLVVSVMLLHSQVKYMKDMDLGFDRENVISVNRITSTIYNAYPSLKAELLQHTNIAAVTGSQSIPGMDRSLQNGYKRGDDPRSAIMIFENRVQHDYLKTYGIELIAGRDFNPEMITDSSAIIINETAARKLGLDDPVGQEIFVWQHQGKVIGVVRDYNFLSLHNDIDPLALTLYEKWFSRVSIRILPGNVNQTLQWIENKFKSVDPNYTFEYTFADDLFARMYRKEEQLNKLIVSAAILAIIISFMGLYALTSFTISKKIKEIGIRKTLGASVPNIINMLFRDLSRWIIIGNIIAWPLAYYAVTRWKQNFAFQIELWDYWYLFVVSGLLAAAIGIMATLIQALSAANANPIESLKSE